MKYLFLAYADENSWDNLPEAEREAWIQDSLAQEASLRRSGQILAGEAVCQAEEALSVTVHGPDLLAEDQAVVGSGPAAGCALAGFYLVQARDLNDAIRLASKLLSARLGRIEIRQLEGSHRAPCCPGK